MRRSQALAILGAVALGMSLLTGPVEARRQPKPDSVPQQPTVSAPQQSDQSAGSGVATGGDPGISPAPAQPPHGNVSVRDAHIWRVDNLTDSLSGSCAPDAGNNGQCTLRLALAQANLQTGTQTIILAQPGKYQLTIPNTVNTPSEDGGLTGDLDILSGRTIVIRGLSPRQSIIQGCDVAANFNCTGIDRILDVQPGATLSLSDLAIRNGFVAGESGGGLRNRGTATLDNVHIYRNIARASGSNEGDGGGIVNQLAAGGSPPQLTVTSSVISKNSSQARNGVGGFGGGIANFGGGQVSLIYTEVSNNSAELNGGGITQNQNNSRLTLTNSFISNNSALAGGGIISGGSGQTFVTLDSTTVDSNTASNNDGGGINMSNSNGTLIITNSTISQNRAQGNSAGGGIRIGGPGSTANITSSSIVNNTASNASAISSAAVNGSQANITLLGTAISGNSSANCSTSYGSTSGNSNNADNGSSCGFAFSNVGSQFGTANPIAGDSTTPVYTPLANLVDKASSCSGQAKDQRGVFRPRPQNGACDIGSVEVEAAPDCTANPRVTVAITKGDPGTGILNISVKANGTNNRILKIEEAASTIFTNVVVVPTVLTAYDPTDNVPDPSAPLGQIPVKFKDTTGLSSVTNNEALFTIRRRDNFAVAGTAQIQVTDRCTQADSTTYKPWKTFVGAGNGPAGGPTPWP